MKLLILTPDGNQRIQQTLENWILSGRKGRINQGENGSNLDLGPLLD
jgi:hypothetical protein